MKIRKATKKDFKELSELVMQNMEYHIKLNKKLSWKPLSKIKKLVSKETEDDLNNPKTTIFLAELDSEVVGYISINLLDKSEYTHGGNRAVIDDLFVLRKYRKKGIGRALFKKARGHLKDKKVENISISVSSNNIPAIKAYEKFGFKETVKKMNLSIK